MDPEAVGRRTVPAPASADVRRGPVDAPPTVPAASGPVDAAPWWLEAIPVAVAALAAGVGSVGLVLAMLDRYDAWLALAGGVPLALVVLVPVLRRDRSRSSPRSVHLAAVAALVLALAFLAFAARTPSEHLLVNRDPGSYVSTATWLERDGSLSVDAHWVGFDPAGTDIEYAGSAQYDMGDAHLEFQFNHLTSVVLAVADHLGGPRLMYRVPAIAVALGLLALYAVAVRLTGRPVLSLAGMAALGLATPVLYVARDTFSESISFLLLWAAVVVLLEVHRRRSVLLGLSGGLLLGATVATRIDSILFVAVLWPAIAISLATQPEDRWRAAARAWAAAAVGVCMIAAVGLVDLFWFAGTYASGHDDQVRPLLMAAVGSAVVSAAGYLAWRHWAALRTRARSVRGVGAWALAAIVVVGFLGAWFVRPHLEVAHFRRSYALIEAIQVRDGLPVDAFRSYAESSVRWTSWYVGAPAMWAAAVGLGVAVHRTIMGRARPAAVVVVGLFVAAGSLSWLRPSIVPDQIWAMRRFVPAVLPAVALAAVYGVSEAAAAIARRFEGRRPPTRRLLRPALAVAGAALLVVPPAVTTWPVRDERELRGFTHVVRWTCDQIGDDQAVIVVGAVRRSLPQTLRNWCGVPVGIAGPGLDVAQVEELIPAAARAGRSLVLVANEPRELVPFAPVITGSVQSAVLLNDRVPYRRLDGPPRGYAGPSQFSVVIAQVG